MVNQEVWNPIKGYEGKYEFSNFHNVKSLERLVERPNGNYFIKEKILKQTSDGKYSQVNLSLNGKVKAFRIHQLVAMEYLDHIPCGYRLVVDHINEITTDNRIENLQIITTRENGIRSIKNKTSKFTGVSWSKNNKKCRAEITINGKSIHLGYFDNEEIASEYYKKALKSHLLGLPIEVKKHNFTSKYTGVSWYKASKKWQASIVINGKSKYLGRFDTELEAHNAHCKALCAL